MTLTINEVRGNIMKITRTIAAPLLTAGLLGGLIVGTAAAAPVAILADGPISTAVDPTYPISGQTGAPVGDAGFGTSPLLPYGTDPQAPVTPGYVNRNHDEGVTSNGEVDLPF